MFANRTCTQNFKYETFGRAYLRIHACKIASENSNNGKRFETKFRICNDEPSSISAKLFPYSDVVKMKIISCWLRIQSSQLYLLDSIVEQAPLALHMEYSTAISTELVNINKNQQQLSHSKFNRFQNSEFQILNYIMLVAKRFT